MDVTTENVNGETSMNDARQAVMAFNARVNESYKNIVPYTPVEGRQSINQQQAEYILSTMNYDRQRPVRQSHVSGIIDKMMTGSWLDGHNIHFAKCNGEFFLVNGQHRLAAVMQCGRKSVFAVTVMPAKSMEDVHRIYCTFDRDARKWLIDNNLMKYHEGDMFNGLIFQNNPGKYAPNVLAAIETAKAASVARLAGAPSGGSKRTIRAIKKSTKLAQKRTGDSRLEVSKPALRQPETSPF